MKARANSDEAVIEIDRNVQRLVRVHHYGLRDRPSWNVKEVPYETRPLLGISSKDSDMIINEVADHLR